MFLSLFKDKQKKDVSDNMYVNFNHQLLSHTNISHL